MATKEIRPPYSLFSQYKKFLDLNSKQKIDSVDPEFLRLNNVATGKDEYKVVKGLRFLDLINEKGEATEKLRGLRVIGDQFKTNLRKVVETSYRDLLKRIIVQSGKPDNVISFFMQKFSMAEGTARQAARIFVELALASGMNVSDELRGMRGKESGVRQKTKSPTAINKLRKPPQASSGKPPGDVDELSLGSIKIWLPKNDTNAAKQAKKLLDLYIDESEKGSRA